MGNMQHCFFSLITALKEKRNPLKRHEYIYYIAKSAVILYHVSAYVFYVGGNWIKMNH